jgi:histidinol-phosphate aminotransferase
VGTPDEMKKFNQAFVKCMDSTHTTMGASLHLPEQYHVPSELYRG